MAQLSCLGVSMPLQRGWANDLEGKEILDERFTKFLSLKDAHAKGSGHGDPSFTKPSKEQEAILKERAAAAIATGGPIGGRTITCAKEECKYPFCRC